MSEASGTIEPGEGPIERLVGRFWRWWNGEFDRDPQAETSATLATEAATPAGPSDPRHTKGWPAERIKVTEALFGEGFVTVGGSEVALSLLKTLGISKEMSVIQLGSGLGGGLRLLAKDFGAWAIGYEISPELAAAATERSEAAKLAKQAKTICRALDQIERKPRVDCFFAKEAFYLQGDKRALFKAIDETLKPRGAIAFTDYVLPSPGHESPLLKAWAATEKEKPHLIDVGEWTDLMTSKGYTVSVTKDITKEYMRDMVKDFEAFARRLKESGVDKTLKKWILAETERWLIRFACLERGEFKVHRFHVIKPAEIR